MFQFGFVWFTGLDCFGKKRLAMTALKLFFHVVIANSSHVGDGLCEAILLLIKHNFELRYFFSEIARLAKSCTDEGEAGLGKRHLLMTIF